MTFQELCKQLGVPYREAGQHHHVSQGFIGIDCPFCSPNSGRFKLGYHVRGRFMTCWTCGWQSVSWAMLQIRPDVGYHKMQELCKGLHGDKVVVMLKRAGKYRVPAITHSIWNENGGLHRRYLAQRGLKRVETVALWRLTAICQSPRLPWRLFIPIISNGQEVSWTTRAIHPDNQPRYVSARPEEELRPHKSLLYGGDFVRNATIIVEGPADVWKVGPGTVATFGTQFTREQVLTLSKIPLRAVVFDSEPAAKRAAGKLCDLLSSFPGKTLRYQCESGKDPGEASVEEIKEMRKKFLGEE